MTRKVYVITDLGPGDGGKGGVVHKISTMLRAHTIIKRGGAQGSHGVRTNRGEKFNFSQWGCGTFEGVPTHLSNQMVVSPTGILNEAQALRYQCGVYDPFELMTVDETALCATPFHGISSRIKELALKDEPRGTIGTGVGEAYRQFRRQSTASILVGDLRGPDLRDKLAAIRESVQHELQFVIEQDFLPEDRATLAEEVRLLYDDAFLDYVTAEFAEAGRLTRKVGADYLGEVILAKEGCAVVETSHGVLTDRLTGFHPHTSAIRTLPRFTRRLLDEAEYTGQVVNIGVTRAYAIRHGAGPLPTETPALTEQLLPGSSKEANRYQGKVRVGPLDFVLLRYAIAACGGPTSFDGLAITWFDQVVANQSWQVCRQYEANEDESLFTSAGDIAVHESDEPFTLKRQSRLCAALAQCQPLVSEISVESALSDDARYALCHQVVEASTHVPVRMVSLGPTEKHKICK